MRYEMDQEALSLTFVLSPLGRGYVIFGWHLITVYRLLSFTSPSPTRRDTFHAPKAGFGVYKAFLVFQFHTKPADFVPLGQQLGKPLGLEFWIQR